MWRCYKLEDGRWMCSYEPMLVAIEWPRWPGPKPNRWQDLIQVGNEVINPVVIEEAALLRTLDGLAARATLEQTRALREPIRAYAGSLALPEFVALRTEESRWTLDFTVVGGRTVGLVVPPIFGPDPDPWRPDGDEPQPWGIVDEQLDANVATDLTLLATMHELTLPSYTRAAAQMRTQIEEVAQSLPLPEGARISFGGY